MAQFEIVMPKLGESVIEATITQWLKNVGDTIEEDDDIVEIATDKVDSSIPSPVEGKLSKLLFKEGDVVPVGEVIALVSIDGEDDTESSENQETDAAEDADEAQTKKEVTEEKQAAKTEATTEPTPVADYTGSDRFYSPLVKSIAAKENISIQELDSIQGSGKDGRVNKHDVLDYLEKRGQAPKEKAPETKPSAATSIAAPPVSVGEGDKVVEMDRMRKLIADHMVMSKHVSPHVTQFIDVDVTNIVNWRNQVKDAFLKREGEKITFTPIFMEAAVQALKDFPQINASVDGHNIIFRSQINIGMATALPNGNLIVPVIKNADRLNLVGLTKAVNDLAARARNNKLSPDEISGGTFTLTNFGSFDSLTGTPIINQPQVGILGVGAIRKQAVVIESPHGDMIGIRQIMILSIAYDHRIVDGALGGMYLKKVKEIMESFNPDRSF